jgi:DNA-directed RNA polymerase III subunit RPC11
MWFCPLDGTLLQVKSSTAPTAATDLATDAPVSQLYCVTCPYSCHITRTLAVTQYPDRKTVDDVLGGAAAWENVDRTAATCPACNHKLAYFMQMQIRSADEPMSIFYKCVKCGHQWNDK